MAGLAECYCTRQKWLNLFLDVFGEEFEGSCSRTVYKVTPPAHRKRRAGLYRTDLDPSLIFCHHQPQWLGPLMLAWLVANQCQVLLHRSLAVIVGRSVRSATVCVCGGGLFVREQKHWR